MAKFLQRAVHKKFGPQILEKIITKEKIPPAIDKTRFKSVERQSPASRARVAGL
jgi:hypothetical protein